MTAFWRTAIGLAHIEQGGWGTREMGAGQVTCATCPSARKTRFCRASTDSWHSAHLTRLLTLPRPANAGA
jgi:hypothetical protein